MNHQELTRHPSLPQPTSFQIKPNERAEGKGRREKLPAQAPTVSVCCYSLCIWQKWHHWGKIHQESASLASVFVLYSDLLTKARWHARTWAWEWTNTQKLENPVSEAVIGKLCRSRKELYILMWEKVCGVLSGVLCSPSLQHV
jgi:hypothetical protein